MKYVLAVLLMIGVVGAADLTAFISGISQFSGPNCRMQGGPSFYDVDVRIQNPSSNKYLRVTYLYYNSSSGQLEDGGKVCDVSAGIGSNCKFRVYTITGGKNATEDISFKIIGWVGDICGNGQYCAGAKEYDTTLSVTVNHTVSMYEQNVLDKIVVGNSEYARVSAQYTGCYNISGHDLLQSSSSEIQRASDLLSICNLHDSLFLANDAIINIRQAEGYAKPASCSAPPPANNTHVNQTPPPHNNTEVPQNESTDQNLNEGENNTPSTENATNLTSTLIKGCIPFSVLAALLVVAVWSERKSINA